jgi:uncharacterized protein (TIGR01777 family)
VSRILISGASGLIGSALVPALETGHEVVPLVRRAPRHKGEIQWDPMHELPADLAAGADAVIHLSGENVAGRWTVEKKRRIRESRVVSTRNLAEALAKGGNPVKTFICASAIGYYGDRGNERLQEESAAGSGFLAEVCREWEGATEPARRAGIRTANLRFGIVLSPQGGALRQMLLPFRLGLGGRIGSGRQWWSWIHLDDAVAAILHVLRTAEVKGPVNIVGPNPVTNAEFTKILASVLRRPAIFPIPAAVARMAFGELAKGGILASARVIPGKLLASAFEFRYPELRQALAEMI